MTRSEVLACTLEICDPAAMIKACLANVTRLTVVPHDSYAKEWWGVDFDISIQDEGRTLKIFLKKKRSAPAKDLGTQKYHQRVVPSKKGYSRKAKHKGKTNG